MPRSNWKGSITFGLVNIPIVLYPSENKAADIAFHQIDKRNNARIKYQRLNVETGKPVPWEDISRGYEYAKDEIIPVPDDILKRVAGENARTIDIEEFIDKKSFDFITIRNSYYIVPDKKGDKGYVILREALNATNKIGIAKVIISTKEYLAAVLPHEDALILCLLKYDEEMRKLSEFDIPHKELSAYKISKKEVDVAKQLIQSMSNKWKPEKYHDEYQKAIHRWVQESVNDKPHTQMKTRSQAKSKTDIVNFVDLLKQSLAADKVTKKARTKEKIPVKMAKKTAEHKNKHATRH